MLAGLIHFLCVRHQAGLLCRANAHCFRFDCGRRSRALAGPWLRIMRSREYFPAESLPSGNLLFAVSCRDKELRLARHSWRLETGLHRIIAIDYRALGAFGSNCGNRNRFSRHKNSAPERAEGQHQTVIEIFCDGRDAPRMISPFRRTSYAHSRQRTGTSGNLPLYGRACCASPTSSYRWTTAPPP